jgi:hypothetical protein
MSSADAESRNLGRGALSIWTYNLKGINYTDDWVPSTAPARSRRTPQDAGVTTQAAFTYGSGVRWGDILTIAFANGKAVVTGSEKVGKAEYNSRRTMS